MTTSNTTRFVAAVAAVAITFRLLALVAGLADADRAAVYTAQRGAPASVAVVLAAAQLPPAVATAQPVRR